MMAPLPVRAGTLGRLSTTALAAILTGVGLLLLGLMIGLVLLLVRAVRTHKRLLSDLERRGVARVEAQAQGSVGPSTTKPRAVLRRNTILPFNTRSGWDAITSVETIDRPDTSSVPPHYAPPKPASFTSKSTRLSWPFSPRRTSAKGIHLRKIRTPILSTVIESPRPSPMVPVLCLNGGQFSPGKSPSRPTSDQSLLQRHPIFRKNWQDGATEYNARIRPEPLRRSLTAKSMPKRDLRVRPNRSKSVAEIPLSTGNGDESPIKRPKHTRSVSVCSQSSGNAPDANLPPLPEEVARIKREARRRSMAMQNPARLSVSSMESTRSSILANQGSPAMAHSGNVCMKKVSRRHWGGSSVGGPRPIRDTLTLHEKNQASQGSIRSSAARFSMAMPSEPQAQADNRNSLITNSSSLQSLKLRTAESITLSRISSPPCSPLTVRSYTPKRHSGFLVDAFGSPQERQKPSSVHKDPFGGPGALRRQISQASTQASSTRSSNGNPFQWDPAPMSCGKPSALKGSPSARKGHRRQNCVRISLQPTYYGPLRPQSRSPSPSAMKDIQEESPNATSEYSAVAGLNSASTAPLPRPPSSSIFNPDVKIATTSIRASLTPSSPTLSMADYDHGPIGSPLSRKPRDSTSDTTERNRKRMSNGSPFSIPTFPSPCRGSRYGEQTTAPPTFALSRPSDEYTNEHHAQNSALAPSSPFEVIIPDFSSDIVDPNYTDEYDPEHPQLVFQAPLSNLKAGAFSFPFQFWNIPEEGSVTSVTMREYERLRVEDSPPCSPKTIRPHIFPATSIDNMSSQSAYQYPAMMAGPGFDTIDPAVLSKDASSALHGGYNCPNTSVLGGTQHDQNDLPMPTSPSSARSMFEPLLQAAFSSGPSIYRPSGAPPTMHDHTQTSTRAMLAAPSLSGQSSPSSVYSTFASTLPSQSYAPEPPSSPRPQHAQLTAPAINFAAVPSLTPLLLEPSNGSSAPLKSSIQQLRRMNSDAEESSKGERRYLQLGRVHSIALPEEESWLDELDAEEDEEAWDEEKGWMLVGDVLDGWEEEATALDIQDQQKSPRAEPSTPLAETPPKQPGQTTSNLSPTSGTENDNQRNSSIWEDGEKFWHSTNPPPPDSPIDPDRDIAPDSSTPLSVPKPSLSVATSRKRDFDVAKDNTDGASPKAENIGSSMRKLLGSRQSKRRDVLGPGTPNVRIQVQPPSAGGTPGSLYDNDGFLRV